PHFAFGFLFWFVWDCIWEIRIGTDWQQRRSRFKDPDRQQRYYYSTLPLPGNTAVRILLDLLTLLGALLRSFAGISYRSPPNYLPSLSSLTLFRIPISCC